STKHKHTQHPKPARRQNQPTNQLSQQHEIQQLNRINSLHTADHKSQPNPEPGTALKLSKSTTMSQRPRLRNALSTRNNYTQVAIERKIGGFVAYQGLVPHGSADCQRQSMKLSPSGCELSRMSHFVICSKVINPRLRRPRRTTKCLLWIASSAVNTCSGSSTFSLFRYAPPSLTARRAADFDFSSPVATSKSIIVVFPSSSDTFAEGDRKSTRLNS